MNEHDFDLTARAWLDDGPTRMSDRAVLSTLDEIHVTRQRRILWPVWRARPVSSFVRVATAAVLVIAVGALAMNLVPRQQDGASVGGPSPWPSASLASDFPLLTQSFVSPRNGFSMHHPDGVTLTPAKQLLGFSAEVDDGFDVVETGLAAVFKAASTGRDFEGAGSIDEYLSDDVLPGGCGVPRTQQATITIDGQSGRVSECPNRVEATVVAGGRLYVFAMVHSRPDARAFFDAWIFTVDLTPETAVDVPAMTITFVSPTYGYSYKFHRGGPTPATERWDPDDETVDFADRFDTVVTGNAAYLQSASTPIPDGVSIDDWVDQFVTPKLAGGCSVPRSLQAEITIDGESGKIAECQDQIEATVVAGGRLYLFTLGHNRSDARAFFDAWMATIDLTPETAASPPSGDGEATASPSEAP
jgi:hypothetical protein